MDDLLVGGPAAAFMHSPLQQYAATLASLAQMQNFLQPPGAAAAANTLPLLYPHLYQSLLTFPNLEQLRMALQSPGSHLQSPKTTSLPKTPETAKTTLSVDTFSPSPRKRASSQKPPSKSEKTALIDGNDVVSSPVKKPRAVKRLQFDDETNSPVSGMFIRDAEDLPPPSQLQAEADLDDSAKFVEITEEAKAEIAKIPNLIGDYICRLCKVKYEDPFKLAQHRCPRIVHEEYRCPECDKVFSCPANLASHRRWHKPRELTNNQPDRDRQISPNLGDSSEPINLSRDDSKGETAYAKLETSSFRCQICGKNFDSHRLLRSHAIDHTEFGVNSANNCSSENPETQERKCPEIHCDLWFPNSTLAEKHAKAVHPRFCCKFCGENFPTSPALTRHINKHHPSDECRVVLLEELKKHQNNLVAPAVLE